MPVHRNDDPGRVKVAAVQMVAEVGDVEGNVRRSLEWIEAAARQGARLVVLPELCTTGYALPDRETARSLAEPVDGPTVARWAEAARRHDLVIIAGLCEREGERVYNSAVAVGGDGVLGVYRKIHLFHRENELFDPGDLPLSVLSLDIGRVGILICYDLRFPEAVRSLALQGADIIALPTAWVTLPEPMRDDRGYSMQAYCAMAHSSMNQVFFVCADLVGPFPYGKEFLGGSLIAGVLGWPVAGPASPDREELLVAEIEPAEARRAKQRNAYNHTFGDLRPEFYRPLPGDPAAGGGGSPRPAPAVAEGGRQRHG